MNDYGWVLIALPMISFTVFMFVTLVRISRKNKFQHGNIFWIYIASLFLLGVLKYVFNMTSDMFIYLFSFITIGVSLVILVVKDKSKEA